MIRWSNVAPYLPVALALIVVAFLDSPSNDKFQFWYAGHLVATGRSPYDPAAWSDAARLGAPADLVARSCQDPTSAACRWIYTPWLAWFYVPFGLLDPGTGMLAASAALCLASLAGVVLIARESGLRAPHQTVFGLCVALCAPYVWNTFLGHFGALELVGAALAARALRTTRALPLVAAGALLSLKAHVFLLVGPAVAWRLLLARAWWMLAIATLALLVLVLVGIAADPRVLGAIASAGSKATGLGPPTTWSFADDVSPGAPWLVAAALVIVGAVAAAAALGRSPDTFGLVAVSIALSLVVAPYAHLYDHVVLLPAVAAAIGLAQDAPGPARFGGWAVAAGFVAVTWSAFLLGPHGDEPRAVALIPVATLACLALVRFAATHEAAP